MKWGYTIAFKRQFHNLEDEVTRAVDKGAQRITLILPIFLRRYDGSTVDGKVIDLVYDKSPLIQIPEWIEALRKLSGMGLDVEYRMKFHVHPEDAGGFKPDWWPGYVNVSRNNVLSLAYPYLVRILSRVANKYVRVSEVVVGVELAGVALRWNWRRICSFVRKEIEGVKVYYGANFWQPIRMAHDRLIGFIVRWMGKERALKMLLANMPEYMPADEGLLGPMADIFLNCKLDRSFWSNFDAVGLSCYWYPSMTLLSEDPEDYYKAYKSWYAGYLVWIRYISDVRAWSKVMGNRLIITEAGPLYNCPLAKSGTPEQVRAWWLGTFRAFEEMGAESMDVWDEMPEGKRFLDVWP